MLKITKRGQSRKQGKKEGRLQHQQADTTTIGATEEQSRQWKHRYIIHQSSSSLLTAMFMIMMMMTLAPAASVSSTSHATDTAAASISLSGMKRTEEGSHEMGRTTRRSRRGLGSSSSSTSSFFNTKSLLDSLHLPHKGESSSIRGASPPLPRFYEIPGTEYVPLSEQDDFSFQSVDAANDDSFHQHSFLREESDVCLPMSSSSSPMLWTSEEGQVKLNGQTIYLKGINW